MTVTLPQSKLDALVSRLRTVEADLAAGPDRDTYVKLSREFSELQPLVEAIKSYQGIESELADRKAKKLAATPARKVGVRKAKTPPKDDGAAQT